MYGNFSLPYLLLIAFPALSLLALIGLLFMGLKPKARQIVVIGLAQAIIIHIIALQIVSDRKEKWYCHIPYRVEIKDDSLDPGRCMGIYVGQTSFVYWAFNYSLERGKIERNEIESFRLCLFTLAKPQAISL